MVTIPAHPHPELDCVANPVIRAMLDEFRALLRARHVASAIDPSRSHYEMLDAWSCAVNCLPGAQGLQTHYAASQIMQEQEGWQAWQAPSDEW